MTAVNTALGTRPDDAVLHEFRALVLFAQGKYQDAAAAIHAVLAVGPGWDWTTLSSLYPSVDVYTEQLRKLENYVKSHPDAADAHFLVAYHYITEGYTDAAVKQLQDVVRLQPKDEVARQLLLMHGGKDQGDASATQAPAPDKGPAIPEQDLVGTWKASGTAGAQFELKLTADHQFTWTYTQQGKQTTASGVYAITGDNLALEPSAGGTMLAQINPPQGGAFHFLAIGGPSGDPGLDFKKS
jgi:tetratricopeptide (TPR) repeat protein